MYIPKHFEEQDTEALFELVQRYPLATLVTNSAVGFCANHVPLRLEQNESCHIVFQGHVARNNPIWRDAAGEALAVFQGAESYITPSLYPSKKEHGKVVPTWNYIAVHASGQIRFIDDQDWKMKFLNSLTNEHESKQEHPWRVADAPADYTENMLEHLVGFELSVEKLVGSWKLSQNRSVADRNGVIEGLTHRPDAKAKELANVMVERWKDEQ